MAKGSAGLAAGAAGGGLLVAAGAAGGGLLFAGAVAYAGGSEVPALQVTAFSVLAVTGSLALLKVKDFVFQAVMAWQAQNIAIQGGMEALAALKDTGHLIVQELRTGRIQVMEKFKATENWLEELYDRMDKCGNKLEVMRGFLVF